MADQKIGEQASSLSLGVTVILLYAIFVSMVTFGFGSYIYRTGWQIDAAQASATTDSGVQTLDIDNMLFVLRREREIETRLTGVVQNIRDLEFEQAMIQTRRDKGFAALSRARNEILTELQQKMSMITLYRDDLPGRYRTQYEGSATDDIVNISTVETLTANLQATGLMDKVEALLDVLKVGLEGVEPGDNLALPYASFYDQSKSDFITFRDNLTNANDASLDLNGELRDVENRISDLTSKRTDLEEIIVELEEKLPPGSIERARLSALAINLPFFPNILMQLVSFPTIFLTLIVTIAAGGLGTVVAFSRRYYSGIDEGLSLSRLFVNVGEGIAAAIAIFLFSGAGMLALTQGGGADNSVELSPYTVAFVAFLSGFMAEHAFASIQNAGKRIFKTDAPKETTPATVTTLPAVVPEPPGSAP